MPKPISATNPILIAGAGITGLVLAHALRKSQIPFLIYDRDDPPSHTNRNDSGWAISIYWALTELRSCILGSVFERIINEAQVLPPEEDMARRRFLFLDLDTCIPRFEIENMDVLRVKRGVFREVLADIDRGGVLVEWGRRMCGFKEIRDEDGGGVEVEFEVECDIADRVELRREKVRGAMLVGADGVRSRTRQLLCPNTWALEQLPVRMLGVKARLTAEEVAPLRAIDPMLFQGCHPTTGTFMWFSILSTPSVNGSLSSSRKSNQPYFEVQINLSWLMDTPTKIEEMEVPESNLERLELMKRLALPFEQRLRAVILNLPENTKAVEIRLQDWPRVEWPNRGGRVTLIGDAAHPMTMYRGEGCNHAILDASALRATILSILDGKVSQASAITAFDAQVASRAQRAVLLSRSACFDAHDMAKLSARSPLLAGRGQEMGLAGEFPGGGGT